jgi:uncharacterized RDD family membrane protein YckC
LSAEDSTAERGAGFYVAGFWRRLAADIVDGAIVVAACGLIGLALGDAAFRLGAWGPVIGFALGAAYLGLGNSRLTGGRTPGKRLVQIVTVGRDGNFLSVERALARGAVLSLIVAGTSPAFDVPVLSTPVVLAALGGGAYLVYGLFFDRETRRGPHDLIVGSYVVEMPPPEPGADPPEGRPLHRRLALGCGGLFAALGIAILVSSITIHPTRLLFGVIPLAETPAAADLRKRIEADPRFTDVDVQRGVSTSLENETAAFDTLRVQVVNHGRCNEVAGECSAAAEEVAAMALATYADVGEIEALQVTVTNRMDMGWFRFSGSVTEVQEVRG